MLFLMLVLPMLLVALLVYACILTVGLTTLRAAFLSANMAVRALLFCGGLVVILSPLLFHLGMEARAQYQADQRQAELAQLERVNLSGRMPRRFITVGNFMPSHVTAIRAHEPLVPFPEAEHERLAAAYRAYRTAELCHRRFPGKMMPGTKIPVCKTMPASLQDALQLEEPFLVFVEGRSTSLREDNVTAGKLYEVRLVTLDEDLLVDYFEERTVKGTPSIFNPYAPPRRRASDTPPPTLLAFIETALKDVR